VFIKKDPDLQVWIQVAACRSLHCQKGSENIEPEGKFANIQFEVTQTPASDKIFKILSLPENTPQRV